jgi:hypothetical protein
MSNPLRVLVLLGDSGPTSKTAAVYTLRGNTANFRVSYDNTLGAAGPVMADAVLATSKQTWPRWWGSSKPSCLRRRFP